MCVNIVATCRGYVLHTELMLCFGGKRDNELVN